MTTPATTSHEPGPKTGPRPGRWMRVTSFVAFAAAVISAIVASRSGSVTRSTTLVEHASGAVEVVRTEPSMLAMGLWMFAMCCVFVGASALIGSFVVAADANSRTAE